MIRYLLTLAHLCGVTVGCLLAGVLLVLSVVCAFFIGSRFDYGYYNGGYEAIDFTLVGILCTGAAMCIMAIMMFWVMPIS